MYLIGFSLRCLFFTLVGLAALTSCHQADPVDEQVRGGLRAIRPLLPIFFQEQDGFLANLNRDSYQYEEVTEAFGRDFETFVRGHDLNYRFNERKELLDAAGHPVRVFCRTAKDGTVALRFGAARSSAAGSVAPIQIEFDNVYQFRR